MALDGTYDGLQASIADFLNRDDLTASIPDFIRLIETKLNRVLRLRLRESDVALQTVQGLRFVPLPPAFDEAVTLWIEWPWGREQLEPVIASNLTTSATPGRPYFWTVDGGSLAFERPADQVYTLSLRCLSKFSLADGTFSATSLLADWPDVYLYGALIASAPYLRDDERITTWRGLFGEALAEAQQHESRARSRGPLRVDPALTRPRRFNIFSGE